MRPLLFTLLLLSVFNAAPALAQSSSPQVSAVSPTTARAGDQIVINGSNFGSSQGSGNVWLGSTYGVVVSWSDSQVVAAVASGSQSGVAQVLQGSVWSNPVNFTVITPNIASATPTTAIAGTQIAITGTGFGASQGSGNVWLGSTYGVVVSWSDTQVVANVASGSKSGVAQILQGGVWSNTVNLTVSTPNITNVTPTTAIAGTQITIAGTGFGASQGSGNVWLGSTYGVVVSWSDTHVVANVASGSKSGVAQILQGGVWSNTVNLTISTPNITSVTPTTAIAGTQVTITGTGFGASQGSGNVWLGSTYGVVVSWSDTQVVANVASGSKSGVAEILQGGVWSNTVNLTVSTPNITSVTPTTAIAGTQITITGTGFGASQGSGNVWLGSTYGVVVSWSDTQVVANVASGSSSGVAQVLQGGVWSNTVNFTVVTPNITAINPTAGNAGTQVTITGTGFGAAQGSGNVWLGSTYGVVVSWSDTQIVATVATGSQTGVAQALQGGVWSNSIQFAIGATSVFVNTRSLNFARELHTATFLNNGLVLVAGGQNRSVSALASAELYNPATGTFTLTGDLNTARNSHTATLLDDGTVLIAGGNDASRNNLASAELYNPATQTFFPITNMTTGRFRHTATLLNNGAVLIAGGYDSNHLDSAAAELYNPAAATFTPTGNLNTARAYHTATLLNDGTVLLVGGYDSNGNNLASAELYNPATRAFTPAGTLGTARNSHTATLLNDGTVLIAGGFDNDGNVIAAAELYSPATGQFTATHSPNTPRDAYTATLLNNGTVLFAGGYDANFNDTASTELYDASTGAFALSATANIARDSHTATLLADGTVLIAGGFDGSGTPLAAAEVYQPGTLTPLALVSVSINPSNPSVPLATAQPLTAIGTFTDSTTQTLGSVAWSSSDNTVATVTNDTTNRGNSFALASGSVTVNACAGSVCGSTLLTISPSTLTSITIAPSNQVILTGSSVEFRAIASFADGGTEDLTASVAWNSSSLPVATINSVGSASAFTKGTTAITASFGGVTGSTSLTVTPPLAAIAVSPQNAFAVVGGTQQFTAIGTYTDGSTVDLTSTVAWSSSANAIATINSVGLATPVAQGAATITASSSGISSTATLDVTTPLVSIAISPATPPSVPSGLTETVGAIGTFADGSTQDLTGTVSWSSSTPAVATVNSVGLVTSITQGVTTITASLGSVSASVNLTVAPPVLLTANVNPQNPVLPSGVNQQFTATGRFSDGSMRDVTSSVTWASTSSSVATISSVGLATTVGRGSATVSATVNGFAFSTNLTVTAGGSPTITASISPAPNAAGWNHTNVTVTFICTPGGALIISCPGPQVVSTEGMNQVVSGTVTDGAGATATASVTLNIDKTPPVLAVASPADGDSFSVASATATGTISDALSGVSALTCNQVPVTPSGGSFSCNISLNPGVNLVVVRATDLAGNVALTKMHVQCTLPLPAPNSLQITPANVNLVVGGTQQFTAVDELGRPRTDATWTVDNTNVASITTDSQPVLTVLTVGEVTLTATVQGVSAQLKLIISGVALPSGLSAWGILPPSGFNAAGLFPAVPTADGGPGFYSLVTTPSSSPVLQAYTADGQLLWQQPPARISNPMPDAFGGVVVLTADSARNLALMDLDGQTGSPIWQYTVQTGSSLDPNLAIRPDGAILTIEGAPQSTTPLGDYYVPQKYVDVIDGNTGQLTSQTRLPQSFEASNGLSGCQGFSSAVTFASSVTSISVGADGTAYLEYLVLNGTGTTASSDGCMTLVATSVEDSKTYVMTVAPDGSSSPQLLGSGTLTTFSTGPAGSCPGTAFECPDGPVFGAGYYTRPDHVIPDGQGGALATWTNNQVGNTAFQPLMVTRSGGGSYTLPIGSASQMVLGENGTGFATDSRTLVSFDVNSGAVAWTYDSPVSIIAATSGNSLAVQGRDQFGLMRLFHFDSNGVAVGERFVPDQVVAADPLGRLYDAYGVFSGTVVDWADSSWPTTDGEPQGQKASNPTATVTVNFSGPLSPGDNLTFTGIGTCGNTLGLRTCPKKSWLVYIEGVATVSDDASKWTVHQHAVELRSGFWTDSQGTLHFFQTFFNSSILKGDDDPCAPNDSSPDCQGVVSVQQQPGQKKIFWIDAPGSLYLLNNIGGPWIDSLHMTGQFTSKVCNLFLICTNVPWFISIVVDPGSNLDFSLSTYGLGSGPF